MKRPAAVGVGFALIAGSLAVGRGLLRNRQPDAQVVEVTSGPFRVWTTHDGWIESRSVQDVMSSLGGPATVIELAADGSTVAKGDLLARFDSSQWERDAVRLRRDVSVARQDLRVLVEGKLPIEQRRLDMRLAEARRRRSSEEQALRDLQELHTEHLVAAHEVRKQEAALEMARAEEAAAAMELDVTVRHLHPAAVERAASTLAASEQELAMAGGQVSNCVLRASSGGMVGHKPWPAGNEVRTVRAGDTVYRNQPFLSVSDMKDLEMRCEVPESELTGIPLGGAAEVRPLAYPDLTLTGRVESVGSMAHSVAGRPAFQKYFGVRIRLGGWDARIRPGMSARARILSYSTPAAVLVPRVALWWEEDRAWCRVQTPGGVEKRAVSTRFADEARIEVLTGVEPGDRLILE